MLMPNNTMFFFKSIVTTLLITTLIMTTIGNSLAHTFTNDESAVFLALIDNMKIKASLIQQSISSGNIDVGKQHIEKLKELYTNHTNEEIAEKNERIANEISTAINYFTSLSSSNQDNFSQSQIDNNVQNLNAILDESIFVRIPQDVLDNSTVQALHFVELVNTVDMNYNNSLEQATQNMSLINNNQSRSEIEDIISYTTTRDLLNIAIDLYESNLKKDGGLVTKNQSETIDKLHEGIEELKTSIELKKPSSEITNTINGTVYPALQELYNFKLQEGEEAGHTEEEGEEAGHTEEEGEEAGK